jgi:hypothetical protein
MKYKTDNITTTFSLVFDKILTANNVIMMFREVRKGNTKRRIDSFENL